MKKLILLAFVAVCFVSISLITFLSFGKSPKSSASLPLPETQQVDATQVAQTKIQIALILDTSNSMDGLIHQAKAQLWKLVNELAKARKDTSDVQIELALYQYGNDYLSLRNGYVQRILPFGTDLDMLSEKLFGLTTNGGSEYCGYAINSSLDELDWDSDTSSLRVIYIAGNEAFTQGPVSYQKACSKAQAKNVIINTIYCGNYESGKHDMWSEGASCNGGLYMNIDSDQQIVYVATPYDQRLEELNLQLNNTYIYYGSKGRDYKQNQLRQDKNAFKYGAANNAQRILSKSNKMYSNSHWDLVDAFTNDSTVLGKIDQNTLADSLQELSALELKSFVLENQIKRQELQDSIVAIGTKIEAYIAEKNADNTGTLGDQLVKTVQTQAGSKGFTFK